MIEAALLTGLRSDLPGQISAQVTVNVYDSPTGRLLLIPQGSRLLGEYDSRVATGQSRLLLAWTRLILPDGRSIILERQPGTDEAGWFACCAVAGNSAPKSAAGGVTAGVESVASLTAVLASANSRLTDAM